VIEDALAPASRNDTKKVLAVFSASFKWAPDVVEDRDAYIIAMAEELRSYPFAVLMEAIQEARRTLKWIPSIAEMVQLAEKRRRPLQNALRRLDHMPSEHRRAEEALAAAEKQAAEAAEEYGRIEREFIAQFGPLPPGDIRSAWFAMSVLLRCEREREAWEVAIHAGESWSREAAKFMAVIGYLVMAVRQKLLHPGELEDVIEGDLETGRTRVRELGVSPPGGPEWFLEGMDDKGERLLDPYGGNATPLVGERYECIRKQFTRPPGKISIDRT
jgi:hypothetical protein